MKNNFKFKLLSIACLIFSFSLANASDNSVHEGQITVDVNEISAVMANGAPAGAREIQECTKQYHTKLGSPFQVIYQIDPQTKEESATAQYEGDSTVLHPMGLSGDYGFISSGVSAPSDLERIIVHINDQFSGASFLLLFDNKLNPNTECLLS